MTRIAVLVSGGGTNLQALIDAQGRGELKNGVIAAVISMVLLSWQLTILTLFVMPLFVWLQRKVHAGQQQGDECSNDKKRSPSECLKTTSCSGRR